jgi:hypothetical protein
MLVCKKRKKVFFSLFLSVEAPLVADSNEFLYGTFSFFSLSFSSLYVIYSKRKVSQHKKNNEDFS